MQTGGAPQWADPSVSSQGSNMSGQIAAPGGMNAGAHQEALFQPYSTLDEPVMETIMRDVRAVVSKLKVVMLPLDRTPHFVVGYTGVSQTEQNGDNTGSAGGAEPEMSENDRKVIQSLKDWDLWGPLLVCLILAVLLSFKAPTNQASLVFASVFITVWLGSAIVTVNAQLLGGNISFFQSVCVLGYCIFPMTLAAFIIDLLKLTWFSKWTWLDMILIAAAFLWATRASSVFIGLYVNKERRFLAVFPVLFFYTFVGWMILIF